MTSDFTLDNFSEEQKYRVLFEGKIKEHVTLETAKQNVTTLLKLDPQNVDNFFSGQIVTLKTNLSFEEGEKLKAIFDRTGAVCVVRSMEKKKEETFVPETPVQPEPVEQAGDETEVEAVPEETPTMYSEESPPEVAASPYLDEEAESREPKSKSLIPLIVVFLILAGLVYIVFIKKGAGVPTTEAEFKETTLVKLTNLNSVMQVAITLTLNNEITFPSELGDIEVLIKEQASFMPKEAIKQGKELLVDGWGDEIIYQHKGKMSYTFRSSGSDGIFETEDDLTLIDGKIDQGRDTASQEVDSLDGPPESP